MLAAATQAERGASPWGSVSLASGHEHLDDAGELVLRAGGVRGGEAPRDAEDVDGGREAWPWATAHSIAEPWAMEKKWSRSRRVRRALPSASVSAIEEEARSS
jgi:hypothetical protein